MLRQVVDAGCSVSGRPDLQSLARLRLDNVLNESRTNRSLLPGIAARFTEKHFFPAF